MRITMNEPKQIDLINPNDQASLEMSLLDFFESKYIGNELTDYEYMKARVCMVFLSAIYEHRFLEKNQEFKIDEPQGIN